MFGSEGADLDPFDRNITPDMGLFERALTPEESTPDSTRRKRSVFLRKVTPPELSPAAPRNQIASFCPLKRIMEDSTPSSCTSQTRSPRLLDISPISSPAPSGESKLLQRRRKGSKDLPQVSASDVQEAAWENHSFGYPNGVASPPQHLRLLPVHEDGTQESSRS
eukprot:gnl/TRDRNA2_/TRDRNA2_70062_c1_seq1.p1 gnl/TRDRNA2_/TRDRNA2_70062_c1~~gnl/TRDRNA2_/TRDRNA2_70062_c1_seq1.p1  ORF type:complete len:185 (+),score=13.11 gnl/TRDRNA2_/TRDRNA2_70062_c1_seq1:63-557(+)